MIDLSSIVYMLDTLVNRSAAHKPIYWEVRVEFFSAWCDFRPRRRII